ncbi:MAG: hypothetical protein PHQ27_04155 [Victivallales bacterium]|nr:hypothetical protein [Victivallales bacterium]
MDKELTVREAMLLVLDQSPQEFAQMKALFKQVSDAFDAADDQIGLQLISEKVFPMIRSLAAFCGTIFDYHLAILGDETGVRFCAALQRLHELLAELAEETGNGNFTEVGDILRFDFFDFITDLEALFPQLRACFVASAAPELECV